jgi:mercuric reductase
MIKFEAKIEGMTCKACEIHVTEALEKIKLENIIVDYQSGESMFEIPEGIEEKSIYAALEATPYKFVEINELPEKKDLSNKPLDNDNYDFDILLIGSGSAAFSAAIKATEYGARIGMIERGVIGGTCVNIGCVPSKALLKAGEINKFAVQNPFAGLHTSANQPDMTELIQQKDLLVNKMRREKYVDLISAYDIELIKGEARFINEYEIEVDGKTYKSKRFLIATGAYPFVPPIKGLDKVDYLTSTSLLDLKEIPERLTVLGSGFIAMELGFLFNNLGSKVTLIQRSEQLLKTYDPEISLSAEHALSEQGITFIKGVQYDGIEQSDDIKKVFITVNGQREVVESDELLVATGRKANTEMLNLKAAHVEVGLRGEVKIDAYCQTSNPRIYAAGDVTDGPQYVYVAAYEGGVAIDNAIGNKKKEINLSAVPSVIFTSPSIASVGLTESQAIEKGYETKVSILHLDAVPRALVNFNTSGVIKLVADSKSQKILGVHMVSDQAGEVIYAATLAVKYGLTITDLTESMAPYLTMAEGLKLAALTFDKDVSKLSCCAN